MKIYIDDVLQKKTRFFNLIDGNLNLYSKDCQFICHINDFRVWGASNLIKKIPVALLSGYGYLKTKSGDFSLVEVDIYNED